MQTNEQAEEYYHLCSKEVKKENCTRLLVYVVMYLWKDSKEISDSHDLSRDQNEWLRSEKAIPSKPPAF